MTRFDSKAPFGARRLTRFDSFDSKSSKRRSSFCAFDLLEPDFGARGRGSAERIELVRVKQDNSNGHSFCLSTGRAHGGDLGTAAPPLARTTAGQRMFCTASGTGVDTNPITACVPLNNRYHSRAAPAEPALVWLHCPMCADPVAGGSHRSHGRKHTEAYCRRHKFPSR